MRTLKIVFLMICASSFVLLGFKQKNTKNKVTNHPYITILGIAQDAGYPQINCEKVCCQAFYDGTEPKKLVTSIGLIDPENEKKWLFEATPDIAEQMRQLSAKHLNNSKLIDGIFLTHAHIGHYTGLMYLGHESMGANEVPVYVMPKMETYLKTNGPWSQLVEYSNILLRPMANEVPVNLSQQIKVTPFLVPHRDEYSETVGYKIEGPKKSLLFIPDINKWQVWEKDIIDEIKKVDYALIDATFLKEGEINRPMENVPHPFISETIDLFKNESVETKSKIYFIHFNHTNPTLKDHSAIKDSIINQGFNFAKEGLNLEL